MVINKLDELLYKTAPTDCYVVWATAPLFVPIIEDHLEKDGNFKTAPPLHSLTITNKDHLAEKKGEDKSGRNAIQPFLPGLLSLASLPCLVSLKRAIIKHKENTKPGFACVWAGLAAKTLVMMCFIALDA